MKRFYAGLVGAVSSVLVVTAAQAGDVWEFNLARAATMKGMLPTVPIFQGTTNSINDSGQSDWGYSSGAPFWRSMSTNIFQPYLLWPTEQRVRSVRIWNDLGAYGVYTWDQVMVDTLTGPPSGATDEANWTNRYTSATGLNTRFVDVDLGTVYLTHGIRVRVKCLTGNNDVNVGEIAVYGPRDGGAQTLSAARQTADGTAASSESIVPSL